MTSSFAIAKAARRIVPGWVVSAGVSLLVALLIVEPFFWMGTASGHDFEFHAASWYDAAQQWREGILYPRWAASMNHGFGEPRFIFYPPLSWILGAALTLLVPATWVPIVYIVLVQTFAGIAAYLLLRELVQHRAAILGATFYAANPNALLITYIRSDFAEQLACAIFPLLLLAALKLTDLLKSRSPLSYRYVLFAVPFAAVWLANAPAGVIATYSMTVLFVWASVQQGTGRFFPRGMAALALGFGLTAFYLLPAAYEQRWVNIAQALSSGLLPSQNFLFTATADPEHTWFNGIASFCALSLILLLGIATLVSQRFAKSQSGGDPQHQVWGVLLVVGAVAAALTLPFTAFLWEILPKLRFVQFPWRWMSMVALIATCFFANALLRRYVWIAAVVLLLLLIPLSYFLINNGWWDPDEMPSQQAAITTGVGYEGTDEYDPLGDDHLDLPPNAPQVAILPADPDSNANPPPGRADVEVWTAENKQIRVRVTAPARIALRLLNYPAWRVTRNGKRITADRLDRWNEMVVPVPAGDSQIRVQFVQTADRAVGLIVSSLSLLFVAILLLAGQYFSSAT